MNFPDDIKYTQDHEWIKLQGDIALVGITDFAQRELGDIVFVDVTSLGKVVNAGEIFGTIEAVKTVSDLFMPITGEILELNAKIDETPELVNKEPYTSGWMVKIKPSDISEIEKLLSSEQYKLQIGQ